MAIPLLESGDVLLSIAQIVPCTEAEGPGRRFAIWFQGCPLRCAGCCNPEMLAFTGGRSQALSDLLPQVRDAAQRQGVEGITLLGGEPVAHAAGAAGLAREVKLLGLTVMVFSGYTLEQIRNMPDPAVHELMVQTDILVDGPYRRELPERRRRWIGSRNQRVHFLSNRYRVDDPCWRLPNTLEIRLTATELLVNGFPAASAAGIWKRVGPAGSGRDAGFPPLPAVLRGERVGVRGLNLARYHADPIEPFAGDGLS